jgi:isopentenyl-diphosphate delta-isomerase
MIDERVTLVNNSDEELGTMDKLLAHVQGRLHRAFSVLIYNEEGELMLQQRAFHKYHSAGLWTNTCCSHPRPGEPLSEAAARRLKEEMGLTCELTLENKFIYHCAFDDDGELYEHELDYIFVGITNSSPHVNAEEVANWKWISITQLNEEVTSHPENFTFWFKEIIKRQLLHAPKN